MGLKVKSEFEIGIPKSQPGSLSTRGEQARTPGLLVSVRSRQEAERAIEGAADILDVKEPLGGSLGMASLDVISDIANLDHVVTKKIPLSVALGEVMDWPDDATVPSLPAGITFAKLGLSQCRLTHDWRGDWNRVRKEFAVCSASQLNWVAVAYADSDQAASPTVSDILEAAITANCAGLLVDTWKKDGRSLLDHVSIRELTRIANRCRRSGLFLALAGRLNPTQLTDLAQSDVSVDVIAIRSAACRGQDRTAEVVTESVVAFKQCLKQRFPQTEIA